VGQEADGRSSADPARPNILYVFSDEHRWQSMGFTEMPELRTPHMARLAAQGVSFTHCISNYPVCSPQRAIQMTGRWPFQQGMLDNNLPLSPHQMTLGKAFRQAGYATAYVGKWHLGGTRAEPFGFDHSLLWTRTGDHWHSCFHPRDSEPVETEGYNATLMTDQAIEFIERHTAEPFFLMLSWNPPHSRFVDAPEEKKALYPRGALKPRPNQTMHDAGGGPHGGAFSTAWDAFQGYHAHVSAIDDELGRLMARLDALGLADNTILIYTSDHGSMLGSHGVGSKRQPYEESIRVPFILRWPGVAPAGTTQDVLLGSIDLMPTLCGLAGIPVPETCRGRDLSAWMRGGEGPRPASQFLMHISKKNASGGDKHPAPLFRGVTTGRHTYAVYADRPWCLFDNREDPWQLHNLIDDPRTAGLQKELRAMLAAWLQEADDPFVLPE